MIVKKELRGSGEVEKGGTGPKEVKPLPLEEVIIQPVSEQYTNAERRDAHDPAEDSVPQGGYATYPFESPLELACYFDRHLNSLSVVPYPWQVEVNEFLAGIGPLSDAGLLTQKPTAKDPLRFCLCAANGSGKDAYVITPFVIWFALTKIRALVVITSSSGVQLTAQTENYIASLAREVNNHYGEPVFKITRRFIKCLKSGSEIRLFATDEAGKAEGYHPLEPNAEMAIIVNEAKSVAPEIFGALSRCTGYNYWLNVSTPGEPMGDFYDSFTNWVYKRRVTAFDCPSHLGKDHITEIRRKYGEASAIYRSQILALFTAVGGQCVIDQDEFNTLLSWCKSGSVRWVKGRVSIGIDLAAGGDENAITVVNGNAIAETLYFREKDTVATEERVSKFLDRYKDAEIYADDGGVGHAIIDRLVRRGYKINRVLNQSRAFNPALFGNRGAEMWYGVKRLIEEKLFYFGELKDTDLLYKQLVYRHYKKNETSGKVTLESKSEAKANGHPSPDRADSLILALSFTNIDTIARAEKKKAVGPIGYTYDELRDQKYIGMRNALLGKSESPHKGGINNSLEAYFNRRHI